MRCPDNRAPHAVPCDNPWTGAHLTAPTSCLSPISRDVRPFSIERFLFVRFPIWVIVTVLFIVVYILVREVLRRYYNAKYEGFFATAHYQEALDTLDAIPSRVTMTTYQQYSRRFFCYEAMENKEMATRMIELMVRMRHSQKRQVQVLTMAFNYYVQIGEKNRAKELLGQLKAVKNVDKAIVTDCQLTYEIVFKKRYDFIDQMETSSTRWRRCSRRLARSCRASSASCSPSNMPTRATRRTPSSTSAATRSWPAPTLPSPGPMLQKRLNSLAYQRLSPYHRVNAPRTDRGTDERGTT